MSDPAVDEDDTIESFFALIDAIEPVVTNVRMKLASFEESGSNYESGYPEVL